MKFNKDKAIEKAQELAEDFDPKKAEGFVQKHQDSSWYEDFVLLLDMIRDDSFKIDTKTYLSIAGALAYVVMPVDLIPDFILGVGWIDDIFVLGYVMNSIADEIERYKTYISQQIR